MKKELKVAIYAICKNEKQFVDKWFESMLEADYICVLDTGSTDGTYEKLLEWQNKHPNKIIISQKTYSLWRFDVARNDSMKLVPEDADILWCTDLDELLEKNWSIDLKTNWQPNQTKGCYLYAWSHTPSGAPGKTFWYDKIHTKGYYWVFPVHEAVLPDPETYKKEVIESISSRILLHHYPDTTKSRSNYLSLVELRIKENPHDAYGYLYYIHESFGQKKYQDCLNFIFEKALCAVEDFIDPLFLSNVYLYAGDCYGMLGQYSKAERCYKLGIGACDYWRENYLALGAHYLYQKEYQKAKDILYQMLEKTVRQYHWLERDLSWSYIPYDLLSQTLFFLGELPQSLDYAQLAVALSPTTEYLQNNVKFLEEFINSNRRESFTAPKPIYDNEG